MSEPEGAIWEQMRYVMQGDQVLWRESLDDEPVWRTVVILRFPLGDHGFLTVDGGDTLLTMAVTTDTSVLIIPATPSRVE